MNDQDYQLLMCDADIEITRGASHTARLSIP